MAIQSTIIENSDTIIFTATGDKMISTIIFCNTAAADPFNPDNNMAYLTMHLVKNGAGFTDPPTLPPQEVVSNANMIVSALAVPAGETVFFDTERLVLQRGDQVIGMVESGAQQLSCTISTVDI